MKSRFFFFFKEVSSSKTCKPVLYTFLVNRQTQWDPPTWEDGDEKDMDTMDLGTPTYDEKSKRKTTTTAAADTSSEDAKKMKDHFRSKVSGFLNNLNSIPRFMDPVLDKQFSLA